MAEKWTGKVAVVTGASAGIGAAIFKELAKQGLIVIGLARRLERVEGLIKELGSTKGKAYAYKCDVSDPQSVTDAFKWIENQFGVVNVLVNNAGIGRNVGTLDEKEDTFKKLNEVIDTNLRGLIQCSREAYRLMKKSDDYGIIININSITGHYVPFMTGSSINVYPSTKFAVTALSESLRHELIYADNKKVRVTSLSPGYVNTEILFASGYIDPKAESPVNESLASMPSLKPEDIAQSVLFVLSTDYNVNITELTIRPVGEKM